MNFFDNEKNEFPEIAEITLKCVVCGHAEFAQLSAEVSRATFFIDSYWRNLSVTCCICNSCGYIHWFLPPSAPMVTLIVEESNQTSDLDDEKTEIVPPQSLGFFLKENL